MTRVLAATLPMSPAKKQDQSDVETTSASSRGSSPEPRKVLQVHEDTSDSTCTLVVRSTFLDIEDTLPLQDRFRQFRRAVTEPSVERYSNGSAIYQPGRYSDEKEGSKQGSEPRELIEGGGMPQVAQDADMSSRSEDEQQLEDTFDDSDDDKRTTVMLRNLPNNYSREMFLQMLDKNGFKSRYDFVYLPFDFGRSANLGYAFVNLVRAADVAAFWRVFQGFSKWTLPTSKVCQVSWSGPHQGFEAHVARYRNSPVMHRSVPDEYKPVIFENGVRQDFPPATRRLKPPGRFAGR